MESKFLLGKGRATPPFFLYAVHSPTIFKGTDTHSTTESTGGSMLCHMVINKLWCLSSASDITVLTICLSAFP